MVMKSYTFFPRDEHLHDVYKVLILVLLFFCLLTCVEKASRMLKKKIRKIFHLYLKLEVR